jgi:intein/homing endonuclease
MEQTQAAKILELFEQVETELSEGVYDPSIFKAIFLAGGPGCFTPHTKVKVEEGHKPIKDVKVGDKVWTLSESGEEVLRCVSENFCYPAPSEMVEIQLEDDELIVCTLEHKIRLSDGSWKEAQDLQEGDDVKCFSKDKS